MSLTFSIKNLGEAFTIFSPVILSCMFLLVSLINNDVKGIILLSMVSILWIIIKLLQNVELFRNEGFSMGMACNMYSLGTSYSSPSFITAVLGFLIFYTFVGPLLFNSSVPSVGLIVFYTVVAVIQYIFGFKLKCFGHKGYWLGMVFGAIVGGLLWSAFTYFGNPQLIFFQDKESSSSNNTQCGMKTKQQFQCKVYKNGQLVKS